MLSRLKAEGAQLLLSNHTEGSQRRERLKAIDEEILLIEKRLGLSPCPAKSFPVDCCSNSEAS